jgi:hypothetical protein
VSATPPKLHGVRALASRSSGQVLVAGWGPASSVAPWTPPASVTAALPDPAVERARYPRLPRVPAGATDAQVVQAMALGWALACHALTGRTCHPQPSRWAPGTLTALTASGRQLGAYGLTPCAYAVTRWRAMLAWTGQPPKGPTAVYGIRWIPGLADQVRAYQRGLESTLVPLGPAGHELADLRVRLDQAIRLSRPGTPQAARAILDGLAPDWRELVQRATTEQADAANELAQRLERKEWVWSK